MKKRNTVLLVLIITLSIIASLIIFIAIIFSMFKPTLEGSSPEIGTAGSSGKTSGNEICVERDGVKYYYYKSLFSKIKFDRFELSAHVDPPGEEKRYEDDKVDITVTKLGKNKFEVVATDVLIYTNNQGREIHSGERLRFHCFDDFSDARIGKYNTLHSDKDRRHYNYITSRFYSQEQFRTTYETALSIEDELNGK